MTREFNEQTGLCERLEGGSRSIKATLRQQGSQVVSDRRTLAKRCHDPNTPAFSRIGIAVGRVTIPIEDGRLDASTRPVRTPDLVGMYP